LHWVGSAKKDYLGFPEQVQSDMGYALGLAQINAKHPKAKPWKGDGPGLFEIVEDYRKDTLIERFTPCALLALFMFCMPFRKSRRPESKRRSPTST
jgi:phage-related protein